MAVTTNRKARLRRVVKEEVLRVLLREQGTPAQQAQQMGLVKAPGFGNYADPNTGKITHQSRGGQLVPTKGAGSEARPQSGITDPPEQDPVAGERGTSRAAKGSPRFGMRPGGKFRAAQQLQQEPNQEPTRPPRADIPQNQPPAAGEPKQPVQRGGPGVGDQHPQPEGPQMPNPRVAMALRKGLNVDAIKLAASTGDTDTVKTGIDFVARIKDQVEKSGSEDDRRALPGIEKIQQKLQQQFGDAVKQSQALSSFQEKPKIGQRAMEP